MKLITAPLFFGFFVAVCLGIPAPSVKDEVEAVRPLRTHDDQPIVDTGYFNGWNNPFMGNPFGGIFNGLESIMEKMRQQMASIFSRLPAINGTNSSFPWFNGVDLPSLSSPFGNIDLSKGNTTSITKVVDGHTVVINETEYKNEDDLGGTFFKVRVIEVKPDNDSTEKENADKTTENPKFKEEIENTYENEISKSREVNNFNQSPEKLRAYA